MNKVLCFGTDGGCLDAFYLNKELNPKDEIFFLSDFLNKGELVNNSEVIGSFDLINNLNGHNYDFIYQCGSIKNHKNRDVWFEKAISLGFEPKTLISNHSYVNPSAIIGSGSIIYPGVRIMRNVVIGKNSIILPNTVINHDVIIGDYTIINSSSVINGNIHIGKKCYIGSNSSFKEKISVCF